MTTYHERRRSHRIAACSYSRAVTSLYQPLRPPLTENRLINVLNDCFCPPAAKKIAHILERPMQEVLPLLHAMRDRGLVELTTDGWILTADAKSRCGAYRLKD